MVSDGIQDSLILYPIFMSGKVSAQFCMDERRHRPLRFCELDPLLFTELQLIFCRAELAAVMEESCCQSLFHIGSIAHCQGSRSVHYADRMLEPFLLQDFGKLFPDFCQFFFHSASPLLTCNYTNCKSY